MDPKAAPRGREMDPTAGMPTREVSRTCLRGISRREGEMGSLDNRRSRQSEIETEGGDARLPCLMERKRSSGAGRA